MLSQASLFSLVLQNKDSFCCVILSGLITVRAELTHLSAFTVASSSPSLSELYLYFKGSKILLHPRTTPFFFQVVLPCSVLSTILDYIHGWHHTVLAFLTYWCAQYVFSPTSPT